MEVSRLDIFLSEFYNIRVGAARGRHDSVHDGVVLPEEHRKVEKLDKHDLWILQTINCLCDIVFYCQNKNLNITFFPHFFAFYNNGNT